MREECAMRFIKPKSLQDDMVEGREAPIQKKGIELVDEQLEGIAGGFFSAGENSGWSCASGNIAHVWAMTGGIRRDPEGNSMSQQEYTCKLCGMTKWA
jgi:hypothetical protein